MFTDRNMDRNLDQPSTLIGADRVREERGVVVDPSLGQRISEERRMSVR